MAFVTAAITAGVLGASAFGMRQKVSGQWVDLTKEEYEVSGKTFLITGGNVGLGYQAAKEIARRSNDVKVVLACRNTTKGNEAVTSLKKETGNDNISCMKLDLASIASVNEFIKEVQSKYESIDVLICNAGVWVPMEKKAKTQDGYEIHFGVNHLAHFAIAKGLIPQLESGDGGRIVFLSSRVMDDGVIDLEQAVYEGRPEKVLGEGEKPPTIVVPTAYQDSKLMNAMTSKYLSTILPSNVTTYSVCPGFCRSSLGRNMDIPLHKVILFTPVLLMTQRSQLQGAQNIIYAACEKKENLESGCMYRDGKLMEAQMAHMESIGGMDVAKKLWDFSEDLLKKH